MPQLFIPPDRQPLPLFITSMSVRFASLLATSAGGPAADGAWPTGGRAYFIPFDIPFYYPVNRVAWLNGASVAGNNDIGFYTRDGAKIWTLGPTAASGASQPQYSNAGIILPPASYFMAVVCSSGSGRMWRLPPGVPQELNAGVRSQDSVSTLPADMSSTVATPDQEWPVFGFTRTTVGY